MKAIILAAGKGERMRPLTETVPKPMLRVRGKALICHMIDALPMEVTEVIVVTDYLAEKIEKGLGSTYAGREITYIRQGPERGTAGALWQCRDRMRTGERFLLGYADDLHDPNAIKELLRYDRGLLVHEVADPSRFGIVYASHAGTVKAIVEKPKVASSNLAAVGVYLLDTNIFTYWPKPDAKGEHVLTDSIAASLNWYEMTAVKSHFWVPVGYPKDLVRASVALAKREHTPFVGTLLGWRERVLAWFRGLIPTEPVAS
ncbi:MAG: nucleotidyltransferase family protein [Patescibacteria group bacterium]